MDIYLYVIYYLTSVASAGNDIITTNSYTLAVMDSKVHRGVGEYSY